jgi:hypothetical protein
LFENSASRNATEWANQRFKGVLVLYRVKLNVGDVVTYRTFVVRQATFYLSLLYFGFLVIVSFKAATMAKALRLLDSSKGVSADGALTFYFHAKFFSV